MKTIGVSESVKNRLDALKVRNGHTSMDSLIRNLISTPCKGTKCILYWNCIEYGCPKFIETAEKCSSVEHHSDVKEAI